jgi:RHS repeat-associated protein
MGGWSNAYIELLAYNNLPKPNHCQLSTVNYQFLAPFGAPIAALNLSAVSNSPNRYLREGKEYIDDFWWNKYDYGWRTFDPLIVRSLQVDPMASKRPWESSYSLWGNNPLRNIDPTGMIWKTTQDEEIAKKIQQNLTAEIKRLEKKAASIQKDIDKINNNIKLSDEKRAVQIEKNESQLSQVNATKEYIAGMNTQVGALGESTTIYSFNNLGENVTSGYLSSPKEGEIVINYVGGVHSFGNQMHETVHATQYERGLFTRSETSPTMFDFKGNARDVAEVAAYMFQYIIAPMSMPYSANGRIRSIQDINIRWLRGILGNDKKPMYP